MPYLVPSVWAAFSALVIQSLFAFHSPSDSEVGDGDVQSVDDIVRAVSDADTNTELFESSDDLDFGLEKDYARHVHAHGVSPGQELEFSVRNLDYDSVAENRTLLASVQKALVRAISDWSKSSKVTVRVVPDRPSAQRQPLHENGTASSVIKTPIRGRSVLAYASVFGSSLNLTKEVSDHGQDLSEHVASALQTVPSISLAIKHPARQLTPGQILTQMTLQAATAKDSDEKVQELKTHIANKIMQLANSDAKPSQKFGGDQNSLGEHFHGAHAVVTKVENGGIQAATAAHGLLQPLRVDEHSDELAALKEGKLAIEQLKRLAEARGKIQSRVSAESNVHRKSTEMKVEQIIAAEELRAAEYTDHVFARLKNVSEHAGVMQQQSESRRQKAIETRRDAAKKADLAMKFQAIAAKKAVEAARQRRDADEAEGKINNPNVGEAMAIAEEMLKAAKDARSMADMSQRELSEDIMSSKAASTSTPSQVARLDDDVSAGLSVGSTPEVGQLAANNPVGPGLGGVPIMPQAPYTTIAGAETDGASFNMHSGGEFDGRPPNDGSSWAGTRPDPQDVPPEGTALPVQAAPQIQQLPGQVANGPEGAYSLPALNAISVKPRLEAFPNMGETVMSQLGDQQREVSRMPFLSPDANYQQGPLVLPVVPTVNPVGVGQRFEVPTPQQRGQATSNRPPPTLSARDAEIEFLEKTLASLRSQDGSAF